MKIKINTSGMLLLGRAGELKQMICPVDRNYICGDVCALFGEPELKALPKGDYLERQIRLVLCHKNLFCREEDFIDERNEDER